MKLECLLAGEDQPPFWNDLPFHVMGNKYRIMNVSS